MAEPGTVHGEEVMAEPGTLDPLVAALGTLGPWGLVGALALKFGVPFVEGIISNSKNNAPVTLENWQALRAKISKPYESL